jgi:TolA-binding protein
MVGYARATSYFAILTIVVGSVIFGLDWQSAPMSPMPDISVEAYAMPPKTAVSSTAAVTPSNPATPMINAPVAKMPSQPKCDVSACARAYRTFRESDCTYKPNVGPRRLCTKGVRDDEVAAKNNPSVAGIPPAVMPPAISAVPPLPPLAPQITGANNVAARIEQGIEYSRRSDYQGAIAAFNEVIKLDRNSTAAFYHRAAVYYNLGDYDRAIQDYDHVLRLEPQNNMAILFRGMASEKKNQR